jgi:hypothetical protein
MTVKNESLHNGGDWVSARGNKSMEKTLNSDKVLVKRSRTMIAEL